MKSISPFLVAALAMQVATPPPSAVDAETAAVPNPVTVRMAKNGKYDEVFRKYTRRFFGPTFDWKVFKAQAMAESGLSESAKSWVGAKGLMQLMPATYSEIQTKNPELGAIDDPRWNIAAGIYYDKKLYDQWAEMNTVQSRLCYVLGSYNAGRGTMLNAKTTVQQEGGDDQHWPTVELYAPKVPRWRYPETLSYVRRIQDYYEILGSRNGFESFLPPPSDQPLPARQ